MLDQLDISSRHEKTLTFLIDIYKYFRENNCAENFLSCHDWEFLVYQRFSEILAKNFPDDGLIAEDFEEKSSNSQYTWLCDPIDGTSNMGTDVSFFSTALSLVYNHTKPVLSFIVDMNKGNIFIAKDSKNMIYSINNETCETLVNNNYMKPEEYILIGKMFGHIPAEQLEGIEKEWWNVAIHSKGYRQLGSTALQMVLDGWKRQIFLYTLSVRWFDVIGSIHFLQNLGYTFQISENNECLILYKSHFFPSKYLEDLIQASHNKWKFFPLNTLEINR